MTDVLLTGGAGFIGCRLARQLVADGARVRVVDNLHPQVHPTQERPADLPDGAELVVGDVTEPSTWDEVFEGFAPDTVVHLAAETGTGQSFDQSSRHGLVNVVGTTRLLDALLHRDIPPAHLVLPSSRAVYGEGAWKAVDGTLTYVGVRSKDDFEAQAWDPVAADGSSLAPVPASADRTEPRPTSVYGATKLAQEHICEAWVSGTGTKLSVFRLQNVYGAGQSLANPYTGIVSLFCRVGLAKETINLYEDGQVVRDFVHVDDVVRAIAAGIAQPPERPRVLDVGSGAAVTIAELAALIADLTGAPDPEVSGMWRVGDVRAASCDPAPLQAALGVRAETTLEAGLQDLLAWIQATT
ncbi:MAG: NAD(P)-dependent oxidoreductase [Actinomycetota bacterium]|nr:NAD(P)-dependent oxidoreductase [Actinomycetota bacterium]